MMWVSVSYLLLLFWCFLDGFESVNYPSMKIMEQASTEPLS